MTPHKQLPTLIFVLLVIQSMALGFLPSATAEPLRTDNTNSKNPPAKSRVLILENPTLVSRFQIQEAKTSQAFNKLLMAFTGKNNLREAWQTLVTPKDRIGIKINTAGGKVLHSHEAIFKAVIAGLQEAGIPRENIILWDKSADHMIAADISPTVAIPDQKPQILSVIPDTGFDPGKYLFHEVIGRLIWGDHEFVGKKQIDLAVLSANTKSSGPDDPDTAKNSSKKTPEQISNRSYFAKIVTSKVDKIINIPVLSDHPGLGIHGALASLALGCIDNSRRFSSTHTSFGDEAIANILTHECLENKVILHILDGLVAQYAGGPSFVANYSLSPGLLMISRDPVAIDSLSLPRLESWRSERDIVPIGENANHLKACEAAGLGTTSKDRMTLITLPL